MGERSNVFFPRLDTQVSPRYLHTLAHSVNLVYLQNFANYITSALFFKTKFLLVFIGLPATLIGFEP